MNITKFASEHRLKITRDGGGEDVELVIDGRIGQSRIYQHDAETFGVAFITGGNRAPRTGLFNSFAAACIEAGMTPTQIGDAEGVFTFDPRNHRQAKAAITGIRARAKRQISPEQAMAGAARLLAAWKARNSGLGTQQEAIS